MTRWRGPALAVALLGWGCGGSPTAPAPPMAPAVTITSLSIASPTASDAAQTLTVGGSNFASGLGVSLRLADGSAVVLAPSQIQGVIASAFQMTVTLNAAGAYSITATNTSGPSSSAFGFTVQAAPTVARTPALLRLTPSAVLQSSAAQTIVINGTDFVGRLGVTATAPDGTITTIDAAQMLNLTTTSCQISLTCSQAGAYQLTVHAPAGPESNALALTVWPVSQTFTLSGSVRDGDAGLTPIAGATVTVLSGDWIGRAAITDAGGGYHLSGLTGEMTVQAFKTGYLRSGIISVTQAKDQTLDFALSAKALLANEFFDLFRPRPEPGR